MDQWNRKKEKVISRQIFILHIKSNILELLKLAINAAIAAGEEIIKIYEDENSDFNIEMKSDDSPLTIADKKSHLRIVEFLNQTDYPILSEEGNQLSYEKRKDWQTFWLIDPLDGTKEFIKRNGEFTVNIALISDNKPILGVVYVPVTKQLFFGSKDYNSVKLELENIHFSDKLFDKVKQLPLNHKRDHLIVVGSRSHMNEDTENFIESLKKTGKEVEIMSKGSSLKLCMVASGEADIYPRYGPTMEWDTAAAHAVVKFAGKNVWLTDKDQELVYNKENLLNPYFIVK